MAQLWAGDLVPREKMESFFGGGSSEAEKGPTHGERGRDLGLCRPARGHRAHSLTGAAVGGEQPPPTLLP